METAVKDQDVAETQMSATVMAITPDLSDDVSPSSTESKASMLTEAKTSATAKVLESKPSAVIEAKVPAEKNQSPSVITNTMNENTTVTLAEIDKNDNHNIVSAVDIELNAAMAKTKISTDEIIHDQGGANINEQQKQVTVVKENDINKANVNLDIKITENHGEEVESNTGFEDAREYAEDEDDYAERRQDQDDNHLERVPDGGSCGEEELLEDEEDLERDDEEAADESQPAASATVPVPVDDDTNDPQYIPRRGRFYEHDDRMAYSTTSSEGSESDSNSEEGEGNDGGEGSDRQNRRRRTSSKKRRSTSAVDTSEGASNEVSEGTSSTKKVLAISKVASAKNSVASTSELSKKPGSRKYRDVDSLDKWTHDMYDEREQTRKTRDELLVSYGYDIREESEAPRARRHHKYGRAATAKYTRSWQDTKAYSGPSGQHLPKVKRGGMIRHSVGGPNKNKNKPGTTDEYTNEFPALNDSKPSESTAVTDSKEISENSSQKSISAHPQEKKTSVVVSTTVPPKHYSSSSRPTQLAKPSLNRSPINNHHQEQQNGGPSPSTHNKNYFNRSSADSFGNKEKSSNQDHSSPAPNSNFYNRKLQQHNSNHNQQHHHKQHYNSGHGNQHQHSPSSGSGSRNFHQYNRDRYYAKGSAPPSSNSNQSYDQPHHNSGAPTSVGTGRTQHSGGHYHNYNNRQYENESQIEQPPPPVVRSAKRYTVQSRRVLPDPVLNFGGMSKTPQPQPPISQHQQQNGLVMEQQIQSQQMQSTPQQLPQQQPMKIQQQIQQQPPLPMQIQQYHQPLQQIHPHHGMVLDHNTGMMVMATADPSMYHHQLYATPQYATAGTGGSATGGADDPNAAAAAAAAALQMLAAQAAVYQPVPTGAAGVTPPPPGAQTFEQQQPDTFMTTYYQPQQQPQQQPPPRRVNLAIPIVAPPPESNQQQGSQKTSVTPTQAPTAASTN